MLDSYNYFDFVPQFVPNIMSGTISHKIRIKKDYQRSDNTSALYLELYQSGHPRKRINLGIAVPLDSFDSKKQRVKTSYKYAKDFNLLIEKLLSDVNKIKVTYRLLEQDLDIESLVEDLTRPSLRVNFNEFYFQLLEHQFEKGVIQESTYKQQSATLKKIKRFKDPWLFSEINQNSFAEFRAFLKLKLKNKPATVEIATKNFKKYLHAANDKGISTDLMFSDLKVKKVEGSITFLFPEEVKKLFDFYKSSFISEAWSDILQRYLFSCFTGLRISDIENINQDNFINDTLVFTVQKTKKLLRVKLNETALSLVDMPDVFRGSYTQQQINKELKLISKACGIDKRLYFHSSRHTFATNYLIAGGQVHNLQRLLGHSKIETTMTYVHVVNSYVNSEIANLDNIVKG